MTEQYLNVIKEALITIKALMIEVDQLKKENQLLKQRL